MGRTSTAAVLAGTDGAYAPFFSPDGEWLAFFTSGKLKKVSVAGGAVVDLCDAGRISAAGGSWGDDGSIIAALNAGAGLTRIPSAGGASTSVTERAQGEFSHAGRRFLPGSRVVVFTSAPSMSALEESNIEAMSLNDLSYDIWTTSMDSDAAGLHAGKPERFLQSPADEFDTAFSPDGRWLAYLSNESGKYEVYVRAFPDTGGKWQISNVGGSNPVWSHNGRELFFRSEDNRIMVAAYTAKGDSFARTSRACGPTRNSRASLGSAA